MSTRLILVKRHIETIDIDRDLEGVLESLVGQPAMIRLSRARLEHARLVADMEIERQTRDLPSKECADPRCELHFYPRNPKQLYHSDNCRVRAFRAQKRLGLIDPAASEATS